MIKNMIPILIAEMNNESLQPKVSTAGVMKSHLVTFVSLSNVKRG